MFVTDIFLKVTNLKPALGEGSPLALKRATKFWWGRERDWGMADYGNGQRFSKVHFSKSRGWIEIRTIQPPGAG